MAARPPGAPGTRPGWTRLRGRGGRSSTAAGPTGPRSRRTRGSPASCVIGCSSETAVGHVPAAASASPASAARRFASARSSASSRPASPASAQMPVFSSTTEAKSSALKRTPSSISAGTGARLEGLRVEDEELLLDADRPRGSSGRRHEGYIERRQECSQEMRWPEARAGRAGLRPVSPLGEGPWAPS